MVSEALTNAAKHAHASVVTIDVAEQDAILKLAIRDDGVGGADPSQGTGLAGLADRIPALGGRFEIVSPARSGISLSIEIPVEEQSATTFTRTCLVLVDEGSHRQVTTRTGRDR